MSGKRERGDYQTPIAFAKAVCAFLKQERQLSYEVVIEPTCGVGSFIKASLVFEPQRVYGIELNPEYCQQCAQDNQDERVRIIQSDCFAFDFASLAGDKSTLVIGNPPWVTTSTLSSLGSNNLPPKANFRGLKGLDALTGESNFDICQSIILKLLAAFKGTHTTIAMLCKTSVARSVFTELVRQQISCQECALYEFDALKVFGIYASAGLFLIELSPHAPGVPASCAVYDLEQPHKLKSRFGFDEQGRWYSNLLSAPVADLEGPCCMEWRQGVKHDCAKVMELIKLSEGTFTNGLKETVELEEDIVFPLVKSSMLKQPLITEFSKYVIVTQRKIREDTAHLAAAVPKTWAYLTAHAKLFDKRKSSIYQGAPVFSMFGIGEYSYAPYKVAISGFYKEPLFALVYEPDGKSVMVDDTVYFLSFENFEEAYVAMLYLNSERVRHFLKSLAFLDAKRPYTKKLLTRLSFHKLVKHIALSELQACEQALKLRSRVTQGMVEHFTKLPALQIKDI